MENLTRTSEHLDRIGQRRSHLRESLATLFPNSPARFVCEIGCGHGHFLAAFAAAHPDQLCIGIDISRERIDRGLRKRNRAKLSNLEFIQAEANDFMGALPTQARISDLYILFPDPWPKRRHHKNRLLQPDFLQAAAKRAGKGARLFFRTDDEAYFRATETLLASDPDWQITSESWPFEHVTVFQSRAAHHYSLVVQLRGA